MAEHVREGKTEKERNRTCVAHAATPEKDKEREKQQT
jgi:hypothetical protein